MAFSSKQYIKSLDGWRGIAILLVFLFHYLPRSPHNPLSWLASVGWWGVDLFFVLSGFLITGILYDTRQSSGFFKSFYARRALRLFPVYFLAVLVVAVGTGFFRDDRSWLLVPFFIYGSNIVLALPHGYPHLLPFDCSHFWTLAVEEQFYSLWPLVVFFASGRRRLMQICFAGIALALALRITLVAAGASFWLSYWELPMRMDSLLAGAFIALYVRGPRQFEGLRVPHLRLGLMAALLAMVPVVLKSHTLFFVSAPMGSVGFSVGAAVASCIICLALIPGTFIQRLGSNSILRFFGRYSYGLYIWHYLFNRAVKPWLADCRRVIHPAILADLIYTLALLALFTAISVLSYHLFEVHFLRLKSRFIATPAEKAAHEGTPETFPTPARELIG
ncbi:MAG TPA: acyltransferase [Terracidiphilus sp.]|nr:acyltransferase [Terracidiphilus sp.]